MRSRADLHKYQQDAIEFATRTKKCAMFLDMGLGKTATSLTVASDFLDKSFISKVLIIAPLRVANTTWAQEAQQWDHLHHLDISIATGTAKRRTEALSNDSDIHIINRENIPWLVENVKWQWDMVIVDESSSFKSPRTRRFKSLRTVLGHLKSILLLSGTPSPNGYQDLWSQIFLIDKGERLGTTITKYRRSYFHQEGYMGYSYSLMEGADSHINAAIDDICISMTADDYLDLPDKIVLTRSVKLSDTHMKQYRELKREFILSLESDTDITASSGAVLANKLLQICNGAIYDEDGKSHVLHDSKLEALKGIVEENPNENFLVAYNYKSDLMRLQECFPDAKTLSKGSEELDAWNRGEIKMLLAHPASAGHGLNMQFGGSVIVWFGLNWSLELYAQFNARLHRQGQTKPVRIMHLVAEGCLDEVVLKALGRKVKTQNGLIDYLKVNV